MMSLKPRQKRTTKYDISAQSEERQYFSYYRICTIAEVKDLLNFPFILLFGSLSMLPVLQCHNYSM